ncbi:unnamed protein product [Haemonchus placei]|uniref:RNA-binding protein 14 n=1 Tax=Haemonchus placei TaxID=6290 RepID=A0A0N4X7B1_HAEPC|nr:unnamed protein product [Haemonchus placei]
MKDFVFDIVYFVFLDPGPFSGSISVMYGYNQGNYGNYGSAYTAAAAAAAVYGNLGVGQAASQAQQQSSSVFGSSTTNPYATYNSVAASYGYGNQSTNAASMYAAQAAQAQVQATQVSRLSADAAYAAAAGVAPSQYSTFGAGQIAGFGSAQPSAGATVGYGRPTATATNHAAKSLAAIASTNNKSALTISWISRLVQTSFYGFYAVKTPPTLIRILTRLFMLQRLLIYTQKQQELRMRG